MFGKQTLYVPFVEEDYSSNGKVSRELLNKTLVFKNYNILNGKKITIHVTYRTNSL